MICPYCDKEKKGTREHVIPDGFIRGMNEKEQIRWTEAAPCRVVQSDLVIKDVCAECNNGVLSQLDTYALYLVTKYNGNINKSTKKLFFKYDYNKLSRWLLKVCYNSARSNKSEYDMNLYKKCAPYIIENKEIKNKISVYAIFMDLSYGKKTYDCYHFDDKSEYTIDFFRIGPFRLRELSTHYCSMRMILVNSFAFLTVVYDEGLSEAEIDNIHQSIMKSKYNVYKLGNDKKIKMIKDKMYWEDSIITNANLRDGYLEKREVKDNSKYYRIDISKEELLQKDYTQIQTFIIPKRNTKEDVLDNYQKFMIFFSGYDDDERELWCISEFQNYIKEIIDKFPEIMWYMKLDVGAFESMHLAYINNNTTLDRINTISVDAEKAKEFMIKCFMGTNKLINDFALDNSYTTKFTDLFNKTIIDIRERMRKVNKED